MITVGVEQNLSTLLQGIVGLFIFDQLVQPDDFGVR